MYFLTYPLWYLANSFHLELLSTVKIVPKKKKTDSVICGLSRVTGKLFLEKDVRGQL